MSENMVDGHDGFREHYEAMHPLGQSFQVGDYYDYRQDQILTDSRLSLKCVALATRVDNEIELRQTSTQESNLSLDISNSNSKWQSFCHGQHLMISTMVGLIPDYLHGASNYLNDLSSPHEVSRTLICRAKSREESLLDVKKFVDACKTLPKSATHVVVSVFYGGEAYCVVSQKVDMDNHHLRKEAEQELLNADEEWKKALKNFETVGEFKNRFEKEKRHQLARLTCRIYADLQSQPVYHGDFFEAYEQCLGLMKNIVLNAPSSTVPISVLLCPLEVLVAKGVKVPIYCDVAWKHTMYSTATMANLKRVIVTAESVGGASQFVAVVSRFQEMMKKTLKKHAIITRTQSSRGCSCISIQDIIACSTCDNRVRRIAEFAREHHLFKCNLLKRWLELRQAEQDMAESMLINGPGIFFSPDHLNADKKYAIFLTIPPLDGTTKAIIESMENCLQELEKRCGTDGLDLEDLAALKGIEKQEESQWHTTQSKRKLILDAVRELANHVKQNEDIKDQVGFFIEFGKEEKHFGYHYSVYGAELKLLKTNIRRLPGPPTGIRLSSDSSSSSVVRAEWDFENLGYPYQFLVEHRLENGPWIQQKTSETQLDISLEHGTTVEVRVAVETCIGRTAFSRIVDTESVAVVAIEDDSKNFALLCSTFVQPSTCGLGTEKTKESMELTELESRRLQETVSGILKLMEKGLEQVKNLRLMKEYIISHRNEEQADHEWDLYLFDESELNFGEFVTNCNDCKVTCHTSCSLKKEKFACDVMDHLMPEANRTCRVCPGHCLWSVHSNNSFLFRPSLQTISLENIKKKYEIELKKTLSFEEWIKAVQADIEGKKNDVIKLIVKVVTMHSSEEGVDLLTTSANERISSVIHDIVNIEKEDKSKGYRKRIRQIQFLGQHFLNGRCHSAM